MSRLRQAMSLTPGARIGILFNDGKEEAITAAMETAHFLIKRGYEVVFPEDLAPASADEGITLAQDDDFGAGEIMVLVFGGDGTILSAARRLCGHGVPLLGVNTGTVGFLAEMSPAEFPEAFDRLEDGQAVLDRRMMMQVTVSSHGDSLHRGQSFIALNDAVVNRESFARIVDLDLSVDGLEVDTYHGDGLIVSTPTGSTGYSLSAGGPIVHPDIDVMTVTPICVHRLHARAMVVSSDQIIKVSFPCRELEARLTIDGQVSRTLEGCEEITFRKAGLSTSLITFPDRNFYSVLHAKLSGDPNGKRRARGENHS